MRLTETRLRQAFAAILATSACACGGSSEVATGGTSSSSSSSSGGTSGSSGTPVGTEWTTACGGRTGSVLQGMRITPPIDGAMQRTESAFKALREGVGGDTVSNPDDGDDLWTATTLETVGTLCATATNRAACTEKVQGFRVLPPTRDACYASYGNSLAYDGRSCSTSYILYTRGDDIGVARSLDETRVLMAPFDTLEEAKWAVETAQYAFNCASESGPLSMIRAAETGGYDLKVLEYENCGPTTFAVTVHVATDGTVTELTREDLKKEPSCAVAGRRPRGLRPESRMTRAGVGEHFSAMATLEAAAVIAFRRLQRHLTALGAPEGLLARVRRAVRDEVRHARSTTALARKYGATPAKPRVRPETTRPSLMEIALENAREGCVRETFGALVAQRQVEHAADPEVRAAMAAIADEETEHAALSWDIAAWLESQLDDADRARLAVERRRAVAELERDLATDPTDEPTRRLAGFPAPAEAARMLDALAPLLLAA